jgi:hypothetical protein
MFLKENVEFLKNKKLRLLLFKENVVFLKIKN